MLWGGLISPSRAGTGCGICTNTCPKAMGQMPVGAVRALCVLHPCEALIQNFDEPNAKKTEQGKIYRLINEGEFEGIKGWISLTWVESSFTECQLTVMLEAAGASLSPSTWWRAN